MNIVERCITTPVRAYQRFLSPLLGPHCRYYPTCSQYMIDAIRVHGTMAGIAIGVLRVARCNPFFSGGYDPIEEQCVNDAALNRPGTSTEFLIEKE